MRVLVVCLLAVLGCSVAGGAIVSKCDLKEKLTDKLRVRARKDDVEFDDTLVAKTVCHVEYAAGFNTSAVNEMTIAKEHNTRRKRHDSGVFDLAEYERMPTTVQKPRDKTVWTLYGLFQLSNHLVCEDSRTETHNICSMSCDKLIDDNIEDDLSCVITLLKIVVKDGFSSPYYEDLRTMIKLIYQYECNGTQPSEYFKECV